MKSQIKNWGKAASLALFALTTPQALLASSHMDAPLITRDPGANTTDVYAFRTNDPVSAQEYLTVALAVYPFEEPGVGPNKYNFDENVQYQINISAGTDMAQGRPTYIYNFRFKTNYKNDLTIAQSYLGLISNVNDANQNLTQFYGVEKLTPATKLKQALFQNLAVAPNNQGLVTKYYNQNDDGENPAKEGVALSANLDRYTSQTVYNQAAAPVGAPPAAGYQVFAGQRDDGFYADIQSIFDLDFDFSGPNKPFDSQGGFNVHTIVLNIPISELGLAGDQQVVGVYATTSRPMTTVLNGQNPPSYKTPFVQVGRQGNPLFCEAFIPIKYKDIYNQVGPGNDSKLFGTYALNPELARILQLDQSHSTNRTDLAGIFIPDLIKVDLSTGPARLAGGTNSGAAPNDAGFHRLSIFGGDVLISTVQTGYLGNGTVPGGWPNGRRFGDDVLDIAADALLSDLRNPASPTIFSGDGSFDFDKVKKNDIGYNKVFPYAATPLNGRNHDHH